MEKKKTKLNVPRSKKMFFLNVNLKKYIFKNLVQCVQ